MKFSSLPVNKCTWRIQVDLFLFRGDADNYIAYLQDQDLSSANLAISLNQATIILNET